jgi:hypothetical protein
VYDWLVFCEGRESSLCALRCAVGVCVRSKYLQEKEEVRVRPVEEVCLSGGSLGLA